MCTTPNRTFGMNQLGENLEKQPAAAGRTIFPNPEQCVYTKNYCEENVWKLCDNVRNDHPQDLNKCFAVFISNKGKQIPLWLQKASKREDRLVIWDYHVILIHREEAGSLVYDLDTELPFPCPLDKYVSQGIRDDRTMKPEFRRLFRVVPGDVYLDTFASDRSHMLKEDGTWIAPPPLYPCIHTLGSPNNLDDFISMQDDCGVGSVLTTAQLCQKLS